jgi:transcriptional regulator with XRE-family HTH domain
MVAVVTTMATSATSGTRMTEGGDGPKGLPGLRAAREGKFLTQLELAELVGLNRSTISELEAGIRNAHLRTVRRLAAALDIAPQQLVAAPPRPRRQPARAKEEES